MHNALRIKKKDIIEEIEKGEYLKNMEDHSLPTGNVPINLQSCYDKGEISFKKRSTPSHGCIIDLNDQARTILCSYGRIPRLFVPIRNKRGFYLRPYTITELQKIQGFKEDFKFDGFYIHQVNQIGNAIPPTFITMVIEYFKHLLYEK